jgi:repressor LexA
MKKVETTCAKRKTMGEKIKEYRKMAGFSQEELAAQINVTKQSVSLYEKDRTDMKVSTLETIALVLGVSVHALIDDIEDDSTLEREDEEEMITLFRQMRPRDKKILLDQMRSFLKY